MSVKAELHALIDQLDDEQATELLRAAHELERGGHVGGEVAPRLLVSGRTFFSSRRKTLEELAAEQGVEPIHSLSELRGDFWPEDEDLDEFTEELRRWRDEDGANTRHRR